MFLLSSDLGGGKTTFVKGLAGGIGYEGVVTSPTFMVSRVYKGKKLELHHFDFYRLDDGGIVGMELAELLDDPNAITAVEWGDVVKNVLPMDYVLVKLERVKDGENDRNITIQVPEKFVYLLEGIE